MAAGALTGSRPTGKLNFYTYIGPTNSHFKWIGPIESVSNSFSKSAILSPEGGPWCWDHVPHPSNGQNMPKAMPFRWQKRHFLDGLRFLEFWWQTLLGKTSLSDQPSSQTCSRKKSSLRSLSKFKWLQIPWQWPGNPKTHPWASPKTLPVLCNATHYQHRGNPKVVSGQSQDKPLAMQRQVVCNPKAILRQSPSNPLAILEQSLCNFQADNSKANPWQSVWANMNRNNVRPHLTNKQLASKANKNMTKQNTTTITPWRHRRTK